MWDNVIRYGLCALAWFPMFLKILKGLAKFLRNEGDLLTNTFKSHDLLGVSSILQNLRVPYFIQWRWGSIHEMQKSLRAPISVLRASFHVVQVVLVKLKDSELVQKVRTALQSEEWLRQFRFVDWYSEFLCRVQSWGGRPRTPFKTT